MPFKKIRDIVKNVKGIAKKAVAKAKPRTPGDVAPKIMAAMGNKNLGSGFRRAVTAVAKSDKAGEELNTQNLMKAIKRAGNFKMFKEGGSVIKLVVP
jgi:hypothetical protein